MSRVEKFKKKPNLFKRIFSKDTPKEEESTEEIVSSEDKLNFRYSIITATVVSGLLYILKLLVGLEKQLFFDSLYKFNEIWNLSLYIGEAMFYSAFIPVGFFIINFVFYFVSASNISRKRLEIWYSRSVFYLIYCTFFTLSLIPVFSLSLSGNNSVIMIFIFISAFIVVVFIPHIIIKMITKEQKLRRGYYIYLLIGYIILLIISNQSYFKEMIPTLILDKSIYYSSEDKIVLATFEGNAIGGFLCKINTCLDNPDKGILLNNYHQNGDPSKSTFVVNLSDPNITSGTYEIRVYYQSVFVNLVSKTLKGPNQDDKVLYKNSISRGFHYIFDGQSNNDRKQYFMKYINRMRMELKRDNASYLKLNNAILEFVTIMKQNDYYISEDMMINEVNTLQNILPNTIKEIFDELIYDLVFYVNS